MTSDLLEPPMQRWSTPARWGMAAVLGIVLFTILFEHAMHKPFNHDENQYVASGTMLAREGLLPWVDFPYFHLPYLTFIYAALFKFSPYLLLTARAFSAACATLMLVLLFLHIIELLESRGRNFAIIAALGLIAMMMTPLGFRRGSGSAWNHDAGTCASVLAYLCAYWAFQGKKPLMLWAASGALAAIAFGIRATFVPISGALFFASLFQPNLSWNQRIRCAAMFSGAFLVFLTPLLYLWFTAPEQFLWGNYGYRMLPVSRRQAVRTGLFGRLSLIRSVLFKRVAGSKIPGINDFPTFIMAVTVFLSLALAAINFLRADRVWRYRFGLLFGCALAMLVGAFLPAPVFVQYLYAPTPLAVTCIAMSLALMPSPLARSTVVRCILILAVLLSFHRGTGDYQRSMRSPQPTAWVPMRIHQDGKRIARNIPAGGHIFTLTPILPLEGGARIYPPATNGPFAFRVSQNVPPEKRLALKVIGPMDLEQFLSANPPAGVVTGFEGTLDASINSYASKLGWRRIRLTGKGRLAVPTPTTIPSTRSGV